jgi:E3 ubiquitin-protein ligase RNF115/126
MADQASRDQASEAMYCHACHHQWQRASESIECPACMSASTEIISHDNDPRHFHTPQQHEPAASTQAAAISSAPGANADENAQGAGAPSADAHQASASEAPNSTTGTTGAPTEGSPNVGNGHFPRVTFRFATAAAPPTVTFFTFVTGNVPPPAPENPPPRTEIQPPVTVFGMQFFPPFNGFPSAPPPTVNNSPPAEANQHPRQSAEQTDTPQSDGQQQPQPPQADSHPHHHPHPQVVRMDMLIPFLTSLFNPSHAIFGDAVYSQEARARITTPLREQTQPGGAPPASRPPWWPQPQPPAPGVG